MYKNSKRTCSSSDCFTALPSMPLLLKLPNNIAHKPAETVESAECLLALWDSAAAHRLLAEMEQAARGTQDPQGEASESQG